MTTVKKTSDVFGVSNQVLAESYIDRGQLDEQLALLLDRRTHIALRGASKCGKSWLRQRAINNPVVVQCRLNKTVSDIYVDALSQLDIRLELQTSAERQIRGRVEATGEAGVWILSKLGVKVGVDGQLAASQTSRAAGRDISDLRFIADIVKASERRLVIEDFHYLSIEERKQFAFDLKALWDYGVFVVIIGVWSQSNMLLFLNPDLTNRVCEIPIVWSNDELSQILDKGGAALNLTFTQSFKKAVVKDSFGNAGLLQSLVLSTLDELRIFHRDEAKYSVDDCPALKSAAMHLAEQMSPLYSEFAKRVAHGVRHRKESTGIYGHAMAVILDAEDETLVRGISIDRIFEKASAREPRIQKGNLRTVLEKFESLQVDKDGRGLVLAYNASSGEVTVVDRQLLLYRKYSTVKWPWEDLILEESTASQLR